MRGHTHTEEGENIYMYTCIEIIFYLFIFFQ